jgi:hypothetical protein
MAEVKNAFIKSKMNKDLDARLIPQGEYRDAVNIQVSKSEGDDVGALENVLGNSLISNIESDSGVTGLTCIGYFVDEFNSSVYLFFTDYTDLYTNNISEYNTSANNFIYLYNTRSQVRTQLVHGAFLNFSTNKPIIGVNLLENLLFFTDNRNQPRKINVDLAASNGTSYYNSEDKISVAKYNPYEPILLIKDSALSPGDEECSMYDVSNEYLPDGTTLNPYYDNLFSGDPQFLEDKFVRFSYRFKFEDGEYSIYAPFTQPCFIPKQDGYFIQGDERLTFTTTVVGFMENKVNKIDLQIPLPTSKNNLNSDFLITEIDILYKESDALAVQVVDTIKANSLSGTDQVLEYSYLSTKPTKTLPESDLIRVYDKIPVKAFGQEVISNRIVYSNFQDKHNPPSGIDYQVGVTEKYTETIPGNAKSRIEYPNHNLKENRNYQVGIVLSDRYGRQSSVILSNNTSTQQSGAGFGADTVYLPYNENNNSISFAGNSLKVLFNSLLLGQGFDKNETNGTPDLYNGDINSADYNPLGWYSYKIVVKQLEQEYYNVYTNGAIKGLPDWTTTNSQQNTSFITLLNDNINKVPRDLSEVGPQDKTFRSSVRLFGRVENVSRSFTNIGNVQYLPDDTRLSFITNNIEDLFDLFDVSEAVKNTPITDDANPYYAFFKSESNPFIAEFVTTQNNAADQFGLLNVENQGTPTYKKYENLAVFETQPTTSRLDIFWETATAGLISDLNLAISSGTGNTEATDIDNWNFTLTEASSPGDVIVNDFYFVNILGAQLTPTSVSLVGVVDQFGNNATPKFTLADNQDSTYDIQIAAGNYFYYDNPNGYTYTFTFRVNNTDPNLTINGSLGNVTPSINNATNISLTKPATAVISAINAVNGSNPAGGNSTSDLVYSIVAQSGSAANFQVNNNPSGPSTVTNNSAAAQGSGQFTLRATDAGGAFVDVVFTVNISVAAVDTRFNLSPTNLNDGWGLQYFFTANTTNLTPNAAWPDWIFNGLGNQNRRDFLEGSNTPSSLNTTTLKDVCTTTTTPTGNSGTFINKTSDGGLTTSGVFYVWVEAVNTQNRYQIGTGTQSPFAKGHLNVRFAIQYRDNSSQNWVNAIDILGTTVDQTETTGTWDWDYNPGQTNRGLTILGNGGQYDPSTFFGGLHVVRRTPSATGTYVDSKGGKVFAFDAQKEYRIIIGNISGGGVDEGYEISSNTLWRQFGFFSKTNSYELEQKIGCNNPLGRVTTKEANLYVHDFNAPESNIAPDYGTTPNVYRYESATSSNCGNTFTSTGTYYAAEPFAKYVTQLYTDDALTTKATSVSASSPIRFRRMHLLNTSSTDVSNPEYTKDGAYTAYFNQGLRTSPATPCEF